MEHVILIGMMGSGKTTIGRIISRVTSRNFIDTDHLIEKKTGMSISDIINIKGEAYFRIVEKDVIMSLEPEAPSVISTGGGAVMDDDIFSFLKKAGKTVYLKASPDVLYRRTTNAEVRPLLMHGDRLEIIQRLLGKREPRYLESDIVIESGNRSPADIAEDIIKRLHL